MTEKVAHYKDMEITYDGDALMSWRVQRLIAQGGAASFDAVDAILCGKADEVAERIGGGIEDMAELIVQIVALEGGAAKN